MGEKIKRLKKIWWEWVVITIGAVISAVGYVVFILPMDMVEGGVTGLGIIVKHLTGLPIVGLSSLAVTGIVFFFAIRILGKGFGTKSIYATILMNVLIDVFSILNLKLNLNEGDILLAAFYGGASVGFGLGLIYFAGASTGGADGIGQILWKLKKIPMGRTLIVIDIFVLTLAAIIFIPIKNIMYSMIFIYIEIKVIDMVLNGLRANQRIMIVTDYPDKLKKALFTKLSRGLTIFKGVGGYTEKERKLSGNILTVVLLKPQTLQLKLVDEVTNQPISHVRVKATKDDGFDLSSSPGFMPSSDEMGIVTIKNIAGNVNEGTISINDCGYEFTKTFNLTDNQYKNPEVIYLSKLTGMLIAKLDCDLSGLSIVAKNIENKSVYTKETDGDVADFRRIPVGSYQLYVEHNPLFESETKLIYIDADREIEETLSIKTTYALGVDKKRKINQIKDLILGSYDEVSSYDTCIPQYLMRIAEAPLDFIENIDDKLVHFIGCAISPQEFTQYMLDTSEILGSEISTTIRSKNNIDLYAEASGLPAVTSIGISPYSGSELKDMLQDITNYYENNYRAVGNKLYKDLDNEITQKSDELTIYPIAETWDVAKKLMELSNSELQNKAKQAVMLYIVNHLLINIEEMFHNEDVLKRLRLSTF